MSLTHQELNVKSLTTSTDKEKYGARLRAEPDHRVLGSKLKLKFKEVTFFSLVFKLKTNLMTN